MGSCRDIVSLICTHLELFRTCKLRIEKKNTRSLTIEERDLELKLTLAADDKLHPALFSPEAEHKVISFFYLNKINNQLFYSTFNLGLSHLIYTIFFSICRFSSILWMVSFHTLFSQRMHSALYSTTLSGSFLLVL